MIQSRFSPYTLLAILHDLLAAALVWWLAYLLRFNFDMPALYRQDCWQTMQWVIPLQSLVFYGFSLYRGVWRYASVTDLKRILWAVLAATALIPLILGLFRLQAVVPRSVLILDPLLLLMLMGGSRLIYRLWKENLLYGNFHLHGEPVIIVGAGSAGINLSKELACSQEWNLVGFLDDDLQKKGRLANGIKVLGGIETLPDFAKRFHVQHIIVAMPSAPHQVRKRVIALATQHGFQAKMVPTFDDLFSGRVAVSQLRAVELDDLLGRDPIALDDAGLQQQLNGKVVLVTGAGGSIGSELCRQICRFAPKKLLLFEASEFALYTIEQELGKKFPTLQIYYLAGDVRDATRLDNVFADYQPQVVFHAAAYKHVPLMERHNSWQAVRNNVFGTWQVGLCAQRHAVEKFVLISTDKAVNPTNVMGTTKRLAEMICQGLQNNQLNQQVTKFIIVRFGNVLGSNGSVIPKFNEQIANGGPITVTHPEITRYFMSIPEAAQLVMQAGYMGQGGEIFVLDMGEAVKIVDLAKDLIRLSGLTEDEIKIEFTGLRPGEKLYEELLADTENTLPTPHRKLRIAQARPVESSELAQLQNWISSPDTVADDRVRSEMRRWVPEYTPELRI